MTLQRSNALLEFCFRDQPFSHDPLVEVVDKLQEDGPTTVIRSVNMDQRIDSGAITFAVDWFSGRTGLQAAKTVSALPSVSAWAGGTLLACAAVWLAGMMQRKLWQQSADEVVARLLPRTTRER